MIGPDSAAMIRLAMALLCALVLAGTLRAAPPQDDSDPTWRLPLITAPKVATPPTIDGVVGDDWNAATLLPPLTSRDPLFGDGVPPRQRTWVWLAYDDEALYVAVRQDLPAQELPVKAAAPADARDTAEGRDNTVNILFSTQPNQLWEQFNISVNANGSLYDRRFDDGTLHYWNPAIQVATRQLEAGWEGEMRIPFADLGLDGAPADGSHWPFYTYSAWRKSGTRLFAWPYVGWRERDQTARLVFGDNVPAVRFEDDGRVTATDPAAVIETTLHYRPRLRGEAYFAPAIATAVKVANVEGGTFESLESIVKRTLANYKQVDAIDEPGEYVLRYQVQAGDKVLARGVQPYYKAPPLDLDVTPYLLIAKKLKVVALTELTDAASLRVALEPGDASAEAAINAGRAELWLDTSNLSDGNYTLRAQLVDASGKTLASHDEPFDKPAAPDWWTMDVGNEPLVPKPWTPVQATPAAVNILGRTYTFNDSAIPAHVRTRDQDLFVAPMVLRGAKPWDSSRLELVETAPDYALYRSTHTLGGATVVITNRVEFDGFMLIDVEMTGSGSLDALELFAPFARQHAQLMQNYVAAPGPTAPTPEKRFTGIIPDEGLRTPPFITTWIGTDRYGFEFSCESSRGWSMQKPGEAMVIQPEGDRVTFSVRLISKPVPLSDTPRRIRFGLVATPTKTLLPYLQKARFEDEIYVALLPGDWSGTFTWHKPVKDPAIIENVRQWVANTHAGHMKLLINGGWNISVQDPENAAFTPEMMAEPLSNVSFSQGKQYAACYNTPYATFLSKSFFYNARLLGFDGIRFDTVIPSYVCESAVHSNDVFDGCGWTDDNGQRWGSHSNFAAREAWKRVYRAFHGGAIDEGYIYTPNAAGPVMAVHSFSDHHEIGEGYYQHADSIKAYEPGMVRSVMTGEAYGLRVHSNLKHGPLFYNERIAALLVNNADPQFRNSFGWEPWYAAQNTPGISIWEAWDWVDRFNAQFRGWWENADLLTLEQRGQDMLLGSFWHNDALKRVLLVVSNYEKHPQDELTVKLNLAGVGLQGTVYAEDAITREPIAISADGTMKLDILQQRYRLVMISPEPPRYREEALGPDLLAEAGAPELIDANWTSPTVTLEPNSVYVLSAQLRIDQPMGVATDTANFMSKWSAVIRHFVAANVSGPDVTGVNGRDARRMVPQKRFARDGVPNPLVPYAKSEAYASAYVPKLWEQTPGWTSFFMPIETGPDAGAAQVVFQITDAGQAQVKDVKLRKVVK